ncbi:hypothetical protein R80B4_02568 [Fibrobacteres bacterium R8-0-B4]
MPAFAYVKVCVIYERRATPVVLASNMGKALKVIQLCNNIRQMYNAFALFCDMQAQILKELVFETFSAFCSRQQLFFQFFEAVRCKAFHVCKRLTANKTIRQ